MCVGGGVGASVVLAGLRGCEHAGDTIKALDTCVCVCVRVSYGRHQVRVCQLRAPYKHRNRPWCDRVVSSPCSGMYSEQYL
jgi:hypothetical protein